MLTSITMRNVATYSDAGVEIVGLKKINFIYGANGCGKTTITRFLDKPDDTLFNSCLQVWSPEPRIKTLVYNKDFKERNFGKGSIDGVFTLGEATKEQIETIEKMQNELNTHKDNGLNRKQSLDTLLENKSNYESEFKDEVWVDIYKEYEADFKEAFRGSIGSRESFKSRLLQEFINNRSSLKTYDELKEKASIIFGETPQLMNPISLIEYTRIVEIESDVIWNKRIIGKTDVEIAKLIQKLNINDWVSDGRMYLQDNATCPFCQKETITEDFRKQLEDFFDEEYNNDTVAIRALSEEYNRLALNLTNLLEQIETQQKLLANAKLNLISFAALTKTLNATITSNIEITSLKIKEPSRKIDLHPTNEQFKDVAKLIDQANIAINEHNNIVANFSQERTNLISEVWKLLIENNRAKIERFNKKVSGFEKGRNSLETQIEKTRSTCKDLIAKIREANKNVTSIQPSVDEINRLLTFYGFTNFEIIPSRISPNQYEIYREDGTMAESTLSEGEISFITFLYFLQLAKGSTSAESINEERILVIDDPISSLDSMILFVISSLIKQIIRSIKNNEGNVKQILLLTHNVYFHKEVSFIDGKSDSDTNANFWILRRKDNVSYIQFFGTKNPVQNSYELLWQELKDYKSNAGTTVQNVMRRIIENYFKILGKFRDNSLIGLFKSVEEQEICRSLLCWINDGSHCLSDDLFIEQQESVIEKYLIVFKSIFDLTGNRGHYEMMMGQGILDIPSHAKNPTTEELAQIEDVQKQ